MRFFALTLALGMSLTAMAQSSAPMKVGIVGLVHGHVGGFFQNSLHLAEIQLVGVAEPDPRLFDTYAKEFNLDKSLYFSDLENMLVKAKPHAVLVYTNTFDHRKVIEICARHGVHVMVEKPLAVSYEDAKAIQRAASDGKIQVLVNYETTWNRSNRTVYDLVHDGSLGEIRKVVVHDGHKGPKEINVQPEFFAWLNDAKLNGGGALFDFGCYGADLMTWLMDGARPLSVTAVTQINKPDIYKVDDEATVILKYPKAQAILQPSWNWPFDRKDMEVYGKTGQAITGRRDEVRVRLAGEEAEKVVQSKPLPAPEDSSLNYFRAVVMNGLKPSGLSSLETNMVVTEILDAARRSAESGRAVTLPLK
jgi:predicted dehydrogenase